MSPIDNKLTLVQIMASQIGDKPLSEPMQAWFTDMALGGDELTGGWRELTLGIHQAIQKYVMIGYWVHSTLWFERKCVKEREKINTTKLCTRNTKCCLVKYQWLNTIGIRLDIWDVVCIMSYNAVFVRCIKVLRNEFFFKILFLRIVFSIPSAITIYHLDMRYFRIMVDRGNIRSHHDNGRAGEGMNRQCTEVIDSSSIVIIVAKNSYMY